MYYRAAGAAQNGYGSGYALGSLGFSIGGALKSIGKGIIKVVGKPVEVIGDVAHGNFKEAAKDLAVTGALVAGAFVAPAALAAAKVGSGLFLNQIIKPTTHTVSTLLHHTAESEAVQKIQENTVTAVNIPDTVIIPENANVHHTGIDLGPIFNPAYANMTLAPAATTPTTMAVAGPSGGGIMNATVGGIPVPVLAIGAIALVALTARR